MDIQQLNKFLNDTMGYLVYQERIMNWLVEFCGFSMAESDTVRRGMSKKESTEKFLPEIRRRFIETMKVRYREDDEEKIIGILEPFEMFSKLLVDIEEKTSVNSRQLDILIRLNFFSEFGENNELLENRNAFFTGKDAY
ncbi:hypothetical protein [Paenibacillus ehimensis]|uniref:hypothetical protein n=1 Tax=Paenibacillus ehimensis TaxID=79264 RepID=UPI000FDAF0F7|nr:hypothetical protein [Paenibacillus ehimensis]MEC0212399.1 hypothetical protein [Paenibacillus ehimensis]